MRALSCLAVVVSVLVAWADVASADGPPLVERMTPTAGPAGTRVLLFGRRLTPTTRFLLGDVELRVVDRLPYRATLEVPDGAASAPIVLVEGEVRVEGPRFVVTSAPSPPTVTAVVPARAPPGADVRLVGRGFPSRPGGLRVSLGDRAAIVEATTPTSIRVRVPAGSASGTFVVRVPGVGEATSPTFEVLPAAEAITAEVPDAGVAHAPSLLPARIVRLDPTSGPEGTRVVVELAEPPEDASLVRVLLAGTRLEIVEVEGTRVEARIPTGAITGPIDVELAGRATGRAPRPFVVTHPPVIERFSPVRGRAGTEVEARGTGFGTDPRRVTATIGGVRAPVVRAEGDLVVVRVPEGARSGPIGIALALEGSTISSERFEVLRE